jgi:uncharacterized protein YxjI
MHTSLKKNQYFVKEHTGIFKASNNYDIFDPATSQLLLKCREPNLGLFSKLFRFTDFKRMTPFHIEIRTPEGAKVLSIKRGMSLLLSKVEVLDENDKIVGYFKQKFFTIGGKFDVFNAQEQIVCTLKGKWTSWDFRFMRGETELASVSKKWAGLGKELFTTADNYMLSINDAVDTSHSSSYNTSDNTRILIVAAVMCIDMVLKE